MSNFTITVKESYPTDYKEREKVWTLQEIREVFDSESLVCKMADEIERLREELENPEQIPHTFGNAIRRVTITEEDEIIYDAERDDVGCTYLVPQRVMDEEIRPKLDEIERLREELRESDEINGRNSKENLRLQKRIEELEAILRRLVERRMGDCFEFVIDDAKAVVGPLESNRHIIPRDKIRKAWEKIKYYTRGNSNPDNHRAAAVVEGVLAELDIVRCEGCWDCADGGGPEYGPRCNGEGFKIGGGDE